jgi:hypothetical protein
MSRYHTLRLGLVLTAVLLPASVRAAEADRLLPDDTAAVVFVNVRQVLDSPVFKKHAQEQIKAILKQNEEVQKLLDAVGLDLFKDVSTLTVANSGSSAEKTLLIAHGNFDLTKIHATADFVAKDHPDALKIHKQGTLRIYEGKGQNANSPAFACFLDKDTVVLSPSRDYVLGAVARSAGKQEAKLSRELQAVLAQVDGKQSVWLAGLVTDAMRQNLGGNPQLSDYAKTLTAYSGTVVLTNDVQLAFLIHTTDATAAANLGNLLNGAKGLAAAAAGNVEQYGPLLADIIDALQVANNKNTVTISGKVSDEMLQKGLKKK